jgi:hypothetical protein
MTSVRIIGAILYLAGESAIPPPHSPAITHITFSSVRRCLLFSKVDYFWTLWSNTLLQSLNACTFHAFCGYCIPLLLVFRKFLETNRRFTLKMNSDVRNSDTRVSERFYRSRSEHRYSTVHRHCGTEWRKHVPKFQNRHKQNLHPSHKYKTSIFEIRCQYCWTWEIDRLQKTTATAATERSSRLRPLAHRLHTYISVEKEYKRPL